MAHPLALAALLVLLAARAESQTPERTFPDPGAESLDDPSDFYAPEPIEQVIISPADNWGTAYWVTWHTNLTFPTIVWLSLDGGLSYVTPYFGNVSRYSFADYTSALIHKVNVTGLKWDTTYFFRIGGPSAESAASPLHRKFLEVEPLTSLAFRKECAPVYYGNFTTAPAPGTPLTFAVIADLGVTNSSRLTLANIRRTGGSHILFAGDFSYADGFQPKWDLWGRMWQRHVASFPLTFCYGNHELEQFAPAYEFERASWGNGQQFWGFYPADSRLASAAGASSYQLEVSAVPGNAFFSTNQGAAHILSLNSYLAHGKYTIQNNFISADLRRVNRTATPFVIVLLHAPWYSTYYYHYLEGENMRTAVEPLLRQYGVDIVFVGHVHAYERFDNVYQYRRDPCGPVHITIGDGGNREGSSSTNYHPHGAGMTPPDYQLWGSLEQPSISLFREYSYGHGTFAIKNASWALWTWYKNQDPGATPPYSGSDTAWIPSHGPLGFYPPSMCQPTAHPWYVPGAGTNSSLYPKYPTYPNGTHPYYSLPPVNDSTLPQWYPLL